MGVKVSSVSTIGETHFSGGLFCYGFTVTYSDGGIRNFIFQSDIENNKVVLRALQKERNKFVKIIGEKGDSSGKD